MRIKLLAVGTRMPDWVQSGFAQYAERFPPEMKMELIEVGAAKRGKRLDIQKVLQQEADAISAKLNSSDWIIALDVKGAAWDTPKLAKRMEQWRQRAGDVTLVIGGPEGLPESILSQANERWSLSNLTLPHPMVRVVVAEALYRAWSINSNHPYHRE